MRPAADRRSAAATGTAWSCRRRTGRPRPPFRPAATSSDRSPARPSAGAKGSGTSRAQRQCGAVGGARRQRRGCAGTGSASAPPAVPAGVRSAPAARCASPITSDSAPIAPATMDAYRMNWPSSPPVMVAFDHRMRAQPQHEHDGAEHQQDRHHASAANGRGCAASRSRTRASTDAPKRAASCVHG